MGQHCLVGWKGLTFGATPGLAVEQHLAVDIETAHLAMQAQVFVGARQFVQRALAVLVLGQAQEQGDLLLPALAVQQAGAGVLAQLADQEFGEAAGPKVAAVGQRATAYQHGAGQLAHGQLEMHRRESQSRQVRAVGHRDADAVPLQCA